MNRLLAINDLRWYGRWPLKWVIFALIVTAVCFPYPGRLVTHLSRWRDPNGLIEPDVAALAPLVEALRPAMTPDIPPDRALSHVQDFVHDRLPYAWDWDTWGTADYLPTVSEALAMGREDCDGRAVVAASLLRHFGFETELVTDFAHVWVKTDKGETMGPGKNKAVIATEKGLRIRWSALAEIPRATAFGIGVFPLVRELIIISALWALMLGRRGGVLRASLGLAALIGGLALLRAGSDVYLQPRVWMQLLGAGLLIAGVATMLLLPGRSTNRAKRIEDRP